MPHRWLLRKILGIKSERDVMREVLSERRTKRATDQLREAERLVTVLDRELDRIEGRRR